MRRPMYIKTAQRVQIWQIPVVFLQSFKYINWRNQGTVQRKKKMSQPTLWGHTGEEEMYLRPFLTWAEVASEWSKSRPVRCTPEKYTGTHWIGGYLGPQNRSGLFKEERTLLPVSEFHSSNHNTVPNMRKWDSINWNYVSSFQSHFQ